jgi:glutamate-1-semialdehyde 2,1-aminomutase
VSDQLYEGLSDVFDQVGFPARVQGLGARFGIFFGFREEVETFADTLKNDNEMAADFLKACAKNGVYFHSYGKLAGGHHGYSASHTSEDINESLNRIESALREIQLTRNS